MNVPINCKNCTKTLNQEDSFCNHCGQKVIRERFTVKLLFAQLLVMITNVERGFWHTLMMLFKAPDKVISDYWNGKTRTYYHPFRYIFIIASVSVLIALSINLYELQQTYINETLGVGDDPRQVELQAKVQKFMSNYMTFVYLLFIPFISFFTHLFYKKKAANYAEHLIANSYIMAQTILLSSVLFLVYALQPEILRYGFFIGILVTSFYFSFVYQKLFQVKWMEAILKGLMSVVLGYLSATLVFGIIGVIVGITYAILTKAI